MLRNAQFCRSFSLALHKLALATPLRLAFVSVFRVSFVGQCSHTVQFAIRRVSVPEPRKKATLCVFTLIRVMSGFLHTHTVHLTLVRADAEAVKKLERQRAHRGTPFSRVNRQKTPSTRVLLPKTLYYHLILAPTHPTPPHPPHALGAGDPRRFVDIALRL